MLGRTREVDSTVPWGGLGEALRGTGRSLTHQGETEKLAWFLQSRRRRFRAGGQEGWRGLHRELRLLRAGPFAGSGPGVVTGKQRNGAHSLRKAIHTPLPSEDRGGGHTRLGETGLYDRQGEEMLVGQHPG